MEANGNRQNGLLSTDELRSHYHCFDDVSKAGRLWLDGKTQLCSVPRLDYDLQLFSKEESQHLVVLDLERTLVELHAYFGRGYVCEDDGFACTLGLQHQ